MIKGFELVNIGNFRNEWRTVRIVIVNFEETHKHKKKRKKEDNGVNWGGRQQPRKWERKGMGAFSTRTNQNTKIK